MGSARLGPLGQSICRVSVSESVPVSQRSVIGLIRLVAHHSTFWADVSLQALSLVTTNTLSESCFSSDSHTVKHIAGRVISVAGHTNIIAILVAISNLSGDLPKAPQVKTALNLSVATITLVLCCLLDTSLRTERRCPRLLRTSRSNYPPLAAREIGTTKVEWIR